MEKEAFESLMEGIKREDTKLPTLCLHDESSDIGHYEGRYEGDEEFQVGVYLIGFTATANQFGRRYAEETRWQPEEWGYSDPEIEVESVVVSDEDDEIALTKGQEQELIKYLEENLTAE